MTEFDHTAHKLIAVDKAGQHLHVTVLDLIRESREALAAGLPSDAVTLIADLQRQIDEIPAPVAAQPSVTSDDINRLAALVASTTADAANAVRQDTAGMIANINDRLAMAEAKLAALFEAIQTAGAK
jgi:hypothetical protein